MRPCENTGKNAEVILSKLPLHLLLSQNSTFLGFCSHKKNMVKRSHQQFKEKAKDRVSDLERKMSDLQFAYKGTRTSDIAILEEQVNQMIREWKAELNEASPATSLVGNNSKGGESDLSSDIWRLLQLGDEEKDDATSNYAEVDGGNLKIEPVELQENNGMERLQSGGPSIYRQEYFGDHVLTEQGVLSIDDYKDISPLEPHHITNFSDNNHLDFMQFNVDQEIPNDNFINYHTTSQTGGSMSHYHQDLHHMSDLLPAISPPASAFLKPKCALWDCPRPAQGSGCYQDYCSSIHSTVAFNEGPPGMKPVLRPGGIDLKDGPLFAALAAKTQGKSVGIPECEGAATTKSPWNAPELFDLSVLDGESLREWLFFDKPRRAFESGSRKQRSLPDYNGRGWHESRKQIMKDFGGLKRSYYMDPQPLCKYEWHLYEYELNNCDICALYRLEFKFVDSKKSSKSKVTIDSLVDLQQQMGRLNAENAVDNGRHSKARAKANQKDVTENFYSPANNLVNEKTNDLQLFDGLGQIPHIDGNPVYGPNLPFGFSVEDLKGYYET